MAFSLVVGYANDALEGKRNQDKRVGALLKRLPENASRPQLGDADGPQSFALDVPITEADVDRWGALLSQSAPPPVPPNANFVGAGFVSAAAVLSMDSEQEQERAMHKLTPMKVFDPSRVTRHAMTKVLMHRRKWLPYRQRLTVYQCRTSIIDAVLRNSVVVLTAPPGSGCTLQLPQIICETEVFKTKRLIVVCPTTLAVQRTVERLREERGEDTASTTVGGCTPTCYEVVAGTQIAVTTAEMFVRQLLCDPTLLHVGCVIFNDVHIRSPVTELCMSLVRSMLRARDECGAGKLGGAPRVVLCCPDESVTTTMVEYFGASHSTQINIQQILQRDLKTGTADALKSSGMYAPPAVLYLEETVQWLTKCDEGVSFLCRDPAEELRHYVENIGVVAKVMAVESADFTSDEKLLSHWCPLIVSAIRHHSLAESKQYTSPSAGNVGPQHPQPRRDPTAVVVVVPNSRAAAIIAQTVRRASQPSEDKGETTLPMDVQILRECITSDELRTILERGSASMRNGSRLVLVTTPIVAQTALPPSLMVGLVIDCARRSYATYDPNTDSDTFSTSYSYIHELRHRRSIARLCLENTDKNEAGESGLSEGPTPMVLQLIPKSVLHSAQHRRASSDPAHHPIFHMPWVDYVHLYHLLQAHMEALCCRELLSSSTCGSAEASAPLSKNVPQLVSSIFVGVASLSTGRYEQLKRIFAAVEGHLFRLAHLKRQSDVCPIPRLLPLGVVAACLALPIPVLRLLMWSQLYGCVVPASVVAAIWLLGDIFCTGQLDDEAAELTRESRIFFSHGSGSDVVSAFHAYRMWLSLRGPGGDSGDAFGTESFVSSEMLLRVEEQQLGLLRLLETTGIMAPLVPVGAHPTEGSGAKLSSKGILRKEDAFCTLASAILEMPETVLLENNCLLHCVTAALYPQYATADGDGFASSLRFVEGAIRGLTTDGGNGTEMMMQRAVSQPSLFCEDSVMSVEEVYKKHSGKPFVYVHRDHEPDGGICVLKGATPLYLDAAAVSCGEQFDCPKSQASRCRGWTSVMTNAWRLTRCARQLPPAAQLPPVSIPLRLYDTIRAPQVVVNLDGILSVSMRLTTFKWLCQLREHTISRLRALVGDKTWTATQQESLALREAWEWWSRRVTNAHAWLREERASCSASDANLIKDGDLKEFLCPYYQYSSNPGRPPMIVPPRRRQGDGAALGVATLASAASGASYQAAYSGKMPDPVMDKNIQHSARSIAKARSREQEATFLKMYPDLFAFLDPEHEFHGYYLYVLRREAPDLEVLGDNLEELEKFLIGLEEEVKQEVGTQSADAPYGDQNGDESCFADGYQGGARGNSTSYQFQEVNAEEYMASYGMQVESSVEHAKRPLTLLRTQDANQTSSSVLDKADAVPAAASFFSQAAEGERSTTGILGDSSVNEPVTAALPNAGSGTLSDNRTFASGQTEADQSTAGAPVGVPVSVFASNTAPADGGVGRAPTLMEQLLAMKAGSTHTPVPAATTAPQNVGMEEALPPGNVQVPGPWPAAPSAVPPVGSGFGFPPSATAGGPTSQSTATNAILTRELLEAMGVIPSQPPVNPLTIPPPPLPAEALANRPPSVLVYPLPPRDYGNIPLILARALGETMSIKVGPTRIVGNIARIEVPNHKVEARALALKSFTCVGRKVHIFKNDRIVDGPRSAEDSKSSGQKRNFRSFGEFGDVTGEGNEGSRYGEEEEEYALPFKNYRSDGNSFMGGYAHDNRFGSNSRASLKKSINPQLIGVLLDSDEDGDDESSDRSASV